MKRENIKNNESNICVKCNGACCRFHSCEVHPEDIFREKTPTIELLINFLSCGKYQIDWWDGDIRDTFNIKYKDNYRNKSYYVRPAHTNSPKTLFDGAWNGTCVFFINGKGCELDFEHRPYGGKALIPDNKKCYSIYGKAQCCLDWSEFYDMIIYLKSNYKYTYQKDGTIKFKKNNNNTPL